MITIKGAAHSGAILDGNWPQAVARPADMKVGLDQKEIQAHGWAVTVFDALALLGKLAPELDKSAQNLLASAPSSG